MRRRRFLHALLAAGLFLAATPLLAWNAAGHRLIATIAWQELGETERAQVDELLRAHPDVERWERRIKAGDPPSLVRFSEASTWPDDIRHDKRFFDEGLDPPTPPLAGFPDMARRRTWHYLNLPIGTPNREAPPEGEIDRRIVRLAEAVGDRRVEPARRAYALAWLIHLVGDIHQPLHVATRHDERGEHDAGGNGVAVFDPDQPRRPETNLHAWWDDLPGPPWLRGPRLIEIGESLRRSHAAPPASRRETVQEVARWRDESFRLANDMVYARTANPPLTISTEYRHDAERIADQQLALAGRRLAGLLRRLLAPPPFRP